MRPWWPHLFAWPRFLDPISWLWLSTKGYAFTSSGEQISIPAGLIFFYWNHTCHVGRCWRPGKHPVDGTPYKTCKKHHPAVPSERVTAEHIADAHDQANAR